jgi:gluconokinase
MVVLIIGVSGAGKSTIGRNLAEYIKCPFVEADDFHSKANKDLMSRGISLTDADRMPWLTILHDIIRYFCLNDTDVVVACSALKESYRRVLIDSNSLNDCVRLVYLKGDSATIESRLDRRGGHFFNPVLQKSQFDALEEPEECITVDIHQKVDQIIRTLVERLGIG